MRLFKELPDYLEKMALSNVNTGCRDQKVCNLRWEWGVQVPELGASVFIMPCQSMKNREDRLVVLNKIALAVINEMRDVHPEYVFTLKRKPLTERAWEKARVAAGLPHVRVDDVKPTVGRRLKRQGCLLKTGKIY